MNSPVLGIDQAVAALNRIDAVPRLLKVICEMTGMRIAVVAHVTAMTWTACAVRDNVNFGLKPGRKLAVHTSFGFELPDSREPIVIEHASADPRCGNHSAPTRYQIESYISVPIYRKSGGYFGHLIALDPRPTMVGEPRMLSMFKEFAALIASQLSVQELRAREHTAWLDERATGELREQFIAILGHDLRNPLQAVYASGDLLERRLSDPSLSAIVSRIKTNVRRMSELIDNVLDFARARVGGGIGLNLVDVENIGTGLVTIVQELQDAQPDARILSQINVNQLVRCDLGRLQQVASNLLGNALTHGLPASPVQFTARVHRDDLVFEVWNAGEPIPPESIAKIFDPFWRNSVSANRHGLGLGLHICSQIVRAHHGTISVTSTRERGTLFTARFPLTVAGQSSVSIDSTHRLNGLHSRRPTSGGSLSMSP